MSGFLSPLIVERLDKRLWKVKQPFEFHLDDAASVLVVVVVPIAFITDFGSIPRFLWRLFPPVGGPCDKAFVIHDKLYTDPRVVIRAGQPPFKHSFMRITREYADNILLEGMRVLGVGWWTQQCIYRGVRWGGKRVWQKHRAQP